MSLFAAPQWDVDESHPSNDTNNVSMETVSPSHKKARRRQRRKPAKDNATSDNESSNITESKPAAFSFKGMVQTLKRGFDSVVGQEKDIESNLDFPQTQESKKMLKRKKRRLKVKLLKQKILTATDSGTEKAVDSIADKVDGLKVDVVKKSKRRKRKKKGVEDGNISNASQEKMESMVEVNEIMEAEPSPIGIKNGALEKKKLKRKIRRQKKKAATSGKVSNLSQDKIEKHEKLQEKVERANNAKTGVANGSNGEDASPETSIGPQQDKDLKSRLKKIARRKRRRANAKTKKLDDEGPNSNEVVLSGSQMKKMLEIARQEKEGQLMVDASKDSNGQGTVNSSYDTSLSEVPTSISGHGNDQSQKKKKRRQRRKKSNKVSDIVDGNVSSTNKNSSDLKNLSSLKADLPDSLEAGDSLEKGQKKKIIIAKLLEQADIVEKSTLHDLKQKRRLERAEEGNESESSKKLKENPGTLKERMSDQLKSARFRWLNEHLYSSNSWEALKFFKEEPDAFEAYHSGYRNQVAVWPVNPLDVIIQSISSLPTGTVVADFGCGEARLAESLPNLKVHSLDLIATKPGVTACDMAHTPLLMESVDVAVFCLSLMGKNLNDFVLEANRVLKNGGLLLIAEVESRFEDVDNFTSALVNFGFHLKKKDLTNQMFIFMDFKKVGKVSKTGKLPTLSLDPCIYKKR